MPEEFAYIIDELLHVQKDEDDNQVQYHKKIIDTILDINNADQFIIALSGLIKQLAVDHLHIVGDIFDRGPYADKILDLLLEHHSLDIEWGNHDILWMGAAAGNEACIANARASLCAPLTWYIWKRAALQPRSADLRSSGTIPWKVFLLSAACPAFPLDNKSTYRSPEFP